MSTSIDEPRMSKWSFPSLRELVPSRSRLTTSILPAGLVGVIGIAFLQGWFQGGSDGVALLTAKVTRGAIPIIISAGGELESALTVDVFCDVETEQIKIVEMVPPGSEVSEGQVVMRLDTSTIARMLAEQEIKAMAAEATAKVAEEEFHIQDDVTASAVAEATLEITLAELEQKKYLQGEYVKDRRTIEGRILIGEQRIQRARDRLDYSSSMLSKSFGSETQVEADRLALRESENELETAQVELQVLTFTREQREIELTAKVEQAKRKLARAITSRDAALAKAKTDWDAAQVTAKLEESVLDKLQREKEHCIINAPQDGIVVYSNSTRSPIELGAMVHFKQKLFSLPNLKEMQVKAYVHESVVKKTQTGQQVEIRIDALPNTVLRGVVQGVESFYDSVRHWSSGGVKEYGTIVSIDELPDAGVKPGMTAEVKIFVKEVQDAIRVPISAVTEEDGKFLCYVVGHSRTEARSVSIGEHNENLVQIVDGLAEGEEVVLYARARADAQINGDTGL